MSAAAARRWKAFSLIGIPAWIGLTVLVAVVNDDPSDPRPVLLAFAGGGAVFFGAMFGAAFWQTRPRPDPKLDALLGELSLEPGSLAGSSGAIGGMSRVARSYIVLGALVTGLGLAAILQEAYGVGSVRVTLYVMVGVVVCWALAVPAVLRYAHNATSAVLGPLGLTQQGTRIAGERHGRKVVIEITSAGSVTRVEAKGGPIVIRRSGHDGAAWLWDLQEAEARASERES